MLVIRGLAWNQVKALLARGWLTHQGTVEFGSVEERRTRYKNLYIASIDYSYSVNGEYYSGYLERLFFLEGLRRQVCRGHEGADGLYPLQPQPSRAFGGVAAGPARWLARLTFKSSAALSWVLDP